MGKRHKLEILTGESHTMADGRVLLDGVELQGVMYVAFNVNTSKFPTVTLGIRVDSIFMDEATIEVLELDGAGNAKV
jgi:hypothetical protein